MTTTQTEDQTVPSSSEETNLSSDAASLSFQSDAETSEVSSDAEVVSEVENTDETSVEAGAQEATAKRKKKRKKKKSSSEGAHGRTANPNAPLSRWFDSKFSSAKKHAFTAGEEVAGRVASIAEHIIIVDLFGKAEALVDVTEPLDMQAQPEPATPPVSAEGSEAGATPEPVAVEVVPQAELVRAGSVTIGQIFKGRIGAVAESGHVAIVNRWIDVDKAKEALLKTRESNPPALTQGLVFGFNRGGFDVLIAGLRVFCPASGMSLQPIDDPTGYVGKNFDFYVAQPKGGTDVVVTRKRILEREAREVAKARLGTLQSGQRLMGRVTRVQPFGVFVDIGGIEGLVHVSELSYQRHIAPESVAKVGDTLEVQIIRVDSENAKKPDQARVSLSVKSLLPDPWDEHVASLIEGTVRKGKVVRLAEFGAFIELAPHIDGLLHVSELGKEIKHPSHVLKVGDEIDVVIEHLDRKTHRVSLSKLSATEAKALAEMNDEAQTQGFKPVRQGDRVKARVEKIEAHGLFLQIVGIVGKRGRGYLSNGDTGTERGTDMRKSFPVGSEIDVKITGVDRDGSLRCSKKALVVEDERKAVQDYRREASKHGLGTFGDLLKAKLGSQSSDRP